MPNLLSTGTTYAGQFYDTILAANTMPVVNTAVTVYQSDGSTVATLYTDQTRGTGLSNPVSTDSFGNLGFYTNPGIYVLSLTVAGSPSTKTVEVLPWYPDAAKNCYEVTANFFPMPGDVVGVNSTTATVAKMPQPTLGAEMTIFNYNTGPCTLRTFSAEKFFALGAAGTVGLTSFVLYQGGSATVQSLDGGNWYVVDGGFGPQVTQIYGMSSPALNNNNVVFTGGSVVTNVGMNTWDGTNLTVSVAGPYLVSLSLTLNGNGGNSTTSAFWQAEPYHNGSRIADTSNGCTGNFYGLFPSVNASVVVNAAANDYFTFGAGCAGMTGTTVGFNQIYCSVALIGGQL